MNIKGKHILEEEVATIWTLLQDEEVLARIAPGISRIEKVSEDNFTAISDISIGPVRGSFEGALSLTDKVENEMMTLVLEQKSKIGNAQATIVMNLANQDGARTLISYEGKAKVSGRLATMGQRILGGVISTLSKQVFKELEVIVEERKTNTQPNISTTEEIDSKSDREENIPKEDEQDKNVKEQDSEGEASSTKTNSKSFIQTIIDKILSIWR